VFSLKVKKLDNIKNLVVRRNKTESMDKFRQ